MVLSCSGLIGMFDVRCSILRATRRFGSITTSPMNSASKDFPHHLGQLRERLMHPTDYEKAVNYFLEEFAGDSEFVRASDPDQAPHLVAVLSCIASRALGKKVDVEDALISHLREHKFLHGNARADGRIVLFFYFREHDTGIAMIIPGVHGEMEIARFRLNGVPDPRAN